MSVKMPSKIYPYSLTRKFRWGFITYSYVFKVFGVLLSATVATWADGKYSLKEWLTCYVLIYTGVLICQVARAIEKRLVRLELEEFANRINRLGREAGE